METWRHAVMKVERYSCDGALCWTRWLGGTTKNRARRNWCGLGLVGVGTEVEWQVGGGGFCESYRGWHGSAAFQETDLGIVDRALECLRYAC